MLTLRLMPWKLSVIKLPSGETYDWVKQSHFFNITQTLDELSAVCETDRVPDHLAQEQGWRILKIEAILDFNLVGIMAKISGTLAEANISIFTISTYNTDYIMIKQEQVDRALASLRENDYNVIADV